MTPDRAAFLARKMADAFPGPNWTPGGIAIWAQDFTDLDEGKVGTTILRLRRTWKDPKRHHPSLPEFLAAYDRLDTSTPIATVACDTCEGTGWEVVLEDPAPFDTPRRPQTTAVRPCSCGNGRGVQQTFDSIRH